LESALVTGGAGFIGSHLCAALLNRNLRVICVDNLSTGRAVNIAALMSHPHFTFLQHDVTDDAVADRIRALHTRIGFVFHLASPASVVDYLRLPLETLLVNSVGTQRMLDLARHHNSRFLFTSTSEIYGDPLVHPQAESYWGNVNPHGPRSCYDESKRFAEALSAQYWRTHDLDARIVRIFNTYGPHSRLDDGRVVPNFIGQALKDEPVTVYGDGSQTRSFCYVSDLVDGLLAVMFAPGLAGEVFNLGNPEEHTILEFATIVNASCRRLRELPDQDLRIDWRPLPTDDPTRRQPDITKAQTVLGWQPRVALYDGLERTVRWFVDQLERSGGMAERARFTGQEPLFSATR
jgi:nucleoside-diphosphate-sugar epimerase